MRLASLITVAGCLAVASGASGAFELQIDVDTVTMTADSAFDVNSYTGSLTFAENVNTSFAGITIDGVTQTVAATLASLSGTVNYVNGAATGGSFLIVLSDGSSYSTSVDTGPSFLFPEPNGFGGDGGTELGEFAGLLGGNLFGGVDVTEWNFGNAPGFFNFSEYDGSASDAGADLNLFMQVPSPGLAAFGLAGVGAGLRRRR